MWHLIETREGGEQWLKHVRIMEVKRVNQEEKKKANNQVEDNQVWGERAETWGTEITGIGKIRIFRASRDLSQTTPKAETSAIGNEYE